VGFLPLIVSALDEVGHAGHCEGDSPMVGRVDDGGPDLKNPRKNKLRRSVRAIVEGLPARRMHPGHGG